MLRKILFTLIAIVAAIPAFAVTDREMEEARAITAKAYLRYANNGSGYLDEINVKSMSELESKLKAKEKENLAAFKSVKVPSDYASWDKERLVEFWAVTFFTSPALDANGKAAKSRVRKQISAMNVSAPAKEAPAAEAAPATPEESPVTAQAEANPAEQPQEASAEAAIDAQEEILADQEAIQKDAEDAQPATPQQESHTWIYVLVLVILVGIVIWLVVYAANLMKRQPGATGSGKTSDSEDDADLRQQTRKAIAKKNEEVAELHRRLQAEEEKSAAIGMELERLKLDRSRLEEKIASLREENARLQQASVAARQYTPRNETAAYETPVREAAPAPATPVASVQDPHYDEPRRERIAEQPVNARVLKVIYLGRANNRGIFVRADRRINPGNTIYRLDTNDGLVGTFHVVDEPEVVETALSAPMDYLANGCTGEELNDTRGVSRIITESSGTAIFENGYWKVLRKSRIRYE